MATSPQSVLRDGWVRQTLGIASWSCLVYNHTLTFDKEVEFIWRAPWTFTKAIFLINRYGNLICQTVIQATEIGWIEHNSLEFCRKFGVFASIFMVSSEESVHILVLLRAWALWGCRRRTAMMLVGSYFIYFLARLAGAVFTAQSVEYRAYQYMNLPQICVAVIPSGTWILAVATACQDTVVFGSTMLSLRQHSRDCQHLYPSALLNLLVRDAVVFYIVCVFFDVFNVVAWIVYAANPKNLLTLTCTLNLLTIAGQRLVLNLRGITARSYGPRSLSAEVDRQLQVIGNAHPEWWSSNGGQSVISRTEYNGGEVEMESFTEI